MKSNCGKIVGFRDFAPDPTGGAHSAPPDPLADRLTAPLTKSWILHCSSAGMRQVITTMLVSPLSRESRSSMLSYCMPQHYVLHSHRCSTFTKFSPSPLGGKWEIPWRKKIAFDPFKIMLPARHCRVEDISRSR